MSGHNKWSKIRHKKSATDQKRGQQFSKLLKTISIAARGEPSPEFNPRLRKAVEKARSNNVPNENIERAIKKSSETDNLEEITLEAYGPGGIAIIIGAITDNRNRTISEIKQLLKENDGKWADPGSVEWAFNTETKDGEKIYKAKFPQDLSSEDKEKLNSLIKNLSSHNDIQKVFNNAK